MSDARTMYCRRCDDAVPVITAWRGWRALRAAWWVGVALLLVLFPVIGADYCVMTPSALGFAFAGGTLHRLANEKPVCRVCSLPLDPGREGGTGVRVRPVPAAGSR